MEKFCLVYKMNFILNTNIKSVSFLDTMNLLVDWYLVCDQCRPTILYAHDSAHFEINKNLWQNTWFSNANGQSFLPPCTTEIFYPPLWATENCFCFGLYILPSPPTSEHSLSAFKLGSAAGFILKHRPNYIIYGWWCGLALPPFNIYNIHIDLKKIKVLRHFVLNLFFNICQGYPKLIWPFFVYYLKIIETFFFGKMI